MSNPRAATLIGTQTPKSQFLKPFLVIFLCFCGLSLCNDWASYLTATFCDNSWVSFFISQNTIVCPWTPLSPITAALRVQWHLIARCSTVIAVFSVYLPIRSICSYVDFMYFLAILHNQWEQVAEKSNVLGCLLNHSCMPWIKSLPLNQQSPCPTFGQSIQDNMLKFGEI